MWKGLKKLIFNTDIDDIRGVSRKRKVTVRLYKQYDNDSDQCLPVLCRVFKQVLHYLSFLSSILP